MNRFLDVYWIIYFLGYLIAVAVMLWLQWDSLLHGDDQVLRLAAIYGVAAGSASAFAILIEGGGRIMLLIPARIRELKRQGRMEQRARLREAYRQFGVKVDGVRVLPDTPEVREFLDSDSAGPDKAGE